MTCRDCTVEMSAEDWKTHRQSRLFHFICITCRARRIKAAIKSLREGASEQ